jgi:hypothetical protein
MFPKFQFQPSGDILKKTVQLAGPQSSKVMKYSPLAAPPVTFVTSAIPGRSDGPPLATANEEADQVIPLVVLTS